MPLSSANEQPRSLGRVFNGMGISSFFGKGSEVGGFERKDDLVEIMGEQW